jgi:DNA-binding MarR family transcriptional regulator
MDIQTNQNSISNEQALALAFANAWNRLERRLDSSLGAIRGVSLAEYRLLKALGDAPGAQASRVDLAEAVGLTPSGVTRALRPMEKLGIITTLKSKRDARLAIAALTPAGRELLSDASGVVDDTMKTVLQRAPKVSADLDQLIELMLDLGG